MPYSLPSGSDYRYGDGSVVSSATLQAIATNPALTSSKTDELVFGSGTASGQQYFKYGANQIADLVVDGDGTNLVVFDYAATNESKRLFSNSENRGSIFVDVSNGNIAYELLDKALMKALDGPNAGEFFAFDNIGFDIAMVEQQVVPGNDNLGSKIEPLVPLNAVINARIATPEDSNTYYKRENYIYEVSGNPNIYREHQDAPDAIALHTFLYNDISFAVGSKLYTNKIEPSGAALNTNFVTAPFGTFYMYEKVVSGVILRTDGATKYYYIVNTINTLTMPQSEYANRAALSYAFSNSVTGDNIYGIKNASVAMQITNKYYPLSGGSGSYTEGSYRYIEVPTLATSPTLKEFSLDNEYASDYNTIWRQVDLSNNRAVVHEYTKVYDGLVRMDNYDSAASSANFSSPYNYKAYTEAALGQAAIDSSIANVDVGFDRTATNVAEPIPLAETWHKDNYYGILVKGTIYRSYGVISRDDFANGYDGYTEYYTFNIMDVLVEMSGSAIQTVSQRVENGLVNISTSTDYNTYSKSTSYESYSATGLYEFSLNISSYMSANDTCLNENETPNVTYTRLANGVLNNGTKYYTDDSLGYQLQRFAFAHGDSPYDNSSRKDLFIMSNSADHYNIIPTANQYVYVSPDLIYQVDTFTGDKKTYFSYLGSSEGLTLQGYADISGYDGTYYQEMNNMGVNIYPEYKWIAKNLVQNQDGSMFYKAFTEGAVAYAVKVEMTPNNSVELMNAGANLPVDTYTKTFDSTGAVARSYANSTNFFHFGANNYSQYSFNSFSTNDVMTSYSTSHDEITSANKYASITLTLQDTLTKVAQDAMLVTTNASVKSYTVFSDIGLGNVAAFSSVESTTIDSKDTSNVTQNTYTYIAQYLVKLGDVYSYSFTEEESIRYDFASITGKFNAQTLSGDVTSLRIVLNSNYNVYNNTYLFKQQNVILGSGLSTVSEYSINSTYLVLNDTITLQAFAADTSKEGFFWQAMNGSGVAQADKWAWSARNLVNKMPEDSPNNEYNAYSRGALAYVAISGEFVLSSAVTLKADASGVLVGVNDVFTKTTNINGATGVMQKGSNYYAFGTPNVIYDIKHAFATGSYNNADVMDIINVADYTGATTDSVTVSENDHLVKKATDLILVTTQTAVKTYESHSDLGAANAFALVEADITGATDKIVLHDNSSVAGSSLYTWKKQYVLQNGINYYADCNLGRLTENVERLAFATSDGVYANVAEADKLHIVSNHNPLENAAPYISHSLDNDVIYRVENSVNIYYVAPNSGNTLTLQEFASDLSYNNGANFGHIYQPIDLSGSSLADTRYSWHARNLAKDEVLANHYMAFSEGAIAYAAFNVTSAVVDLSQNAGSLLTDATYHSDSIVGAMKNASSSATEYFVFNNVITHQDFATGSYATGVVSNMYTTSGDLEDETDSIALTKGDKLEKIASDLILVTGSSSSVPDFYEAWTRTGLRNAAVLTSINTNTSTIKEMSQDPVIEYTYKARYTLKSGTAYYSYASYEIDTSVTEPQVRFHFASLAGGFADASNNDVLYIVTSQEVINDGNNYTMIDNVKNLILGADGNNYLEGQHVENVYFSHLGGSSPLTLPQFADVSGYDGYHFKEISSANLNDSIQYSWAAKNLVVKYDTTEYVAFTDGALAYTAIELNGSSKSIDRRDPTANNGNTEGTPYYLSFTSKKILTNDEIYADSTQYWTYNPYDITRQTFAIDTAGDYVVDDVLYEITYTTDSVSPAKYAVYTPTTAATIAKKDTDLIEVVETSATYFEAWSDAGLQNGSKSSIVSAGSIVNKMTVSTTTTFINRADGLLDLSGESPKKFYSFSAIGLTEELRRLAFAKADASFVNLSSNDFLVIVPSTDPATQYSLSTNTTYQYASDSAYPSTTTTLYIHRNEANGTKQFIVVNVSGQGENFDVDTTPEAVTYKLSFFNQTNPIADNNKWSVMSDSTGVIITASISTAQGFQGLVVYENGIYYADSEASLAYAARATDGGAVPVGAKIVLTNNFSYQYVPEFTNTRVWFKYSKGVLVNYEGVMKDTINDVLVDVSAVAFRSYNNAITENTLAGVPLVLYDNNEKLAAIEFTGTDDSMNSFNLSNLSFNKMVTRVGSESIKVVSPIVSGTTSFEAFGPAGLYQIAALTSPTINANMFIYRRNFGEKATSGDYSGNYNIDTSANQLSRKFNWSEQYLLKDASANIYFDYIDNANISASSNLNNDIHKLAKQMSPFTSVPTGTILYDMSGLTQGTWIDLTETDGSLIYDAKYVLDTSGGSAESYMVVKEVQGNANKRYLMVGDRKAEFAGNSYYANNSTYAEITADGEGSATQRVKMATDLLKLEGTSFYESYSEGGLQTYATDATNYISNRIRLATGVYSNKIGDVSGTQTLKSYWFKQSQNVLIRSKDSLQSFIPTNSTDIHEYRVYNDAITARTFANTSTYDIDDQMLIVSSDLVLANYVLVRKIFDGVNIEDNRSTYNAVAYKYGGLRLAATDDGANSVANSSGSTQSYILYDNSGSTIDFTKVMDGLIEVDGNGLVPSVFFSYNDISGSKLVEFAHSVEQNLGADALDLAFVDNSENSVLYDVSQMGDSDPTTTTETYRFVTKGVIDPSGSTAITICGSNYSVYNNMSNDEHAYLRRAALYAGVPTGTTIGFSGDKFNKISTPYPYGLLSYAYSGSTSYISYLNGSVSGEVLSNTGVPVLSVASFANGSDYANGTFLEMRTADASGNYDLTGSIYEKHASALVWKTQQSYTYTANAATPVGVTSATGTNSNDVVTVSGEQIYYMYADVLSLISNAVKNNIAGNLYNLPLGTRILDVTNNILYIVNGAGLLFNNNDGTNRLYESHYIIATDASYAPSSTEIYLNQTGYAVKKIANGLLLGMSGEYLDKYYAFTNTTASFLGLRSAATNIDATINIDVSSTIFNTPFVAGAPITTTIVGLASLAGTNLNGVVQYTKTKANVLKMVSANSYYDFGNYDEAGYTPRSFAADSSILVNATLTRALTTGIYSSLNGLDYIQKTNSSAVRAALSGAFGSSSPYWCFASTDIYAANDEMDILVKAIAAGSTINEVLASVAITAGTDSASATYSPNNVYTKADATTYPDTIFSTDIDISAAYYTYVADASLNLVLNNYANIVDISGIGAGVGNYSLATSPVHPFIFDISGSTKIQYTHKDTGVLLRNSDSTYHAYGDNGVVRAAQLDEIGSGSFTKDYPNSQTFTRRVDGIVVGTDTTYAVTSGANEVLIYFKNVNSTPDDDRANAYRVIKALARDLSGGSPVLLGLTEYSANGVDLSNVRVVYDVLETSPTKYEYQKNGILKTNVVGASTFNYIAYTDLNTSALSDIATNNGLTVDVSGLIREISGADTNMDTTIDYAKHADGLLMATAAAGSYDALNANAYPYSERGVANYAAIDSRGTATTVGNASSSTFTKFRLAIANSTGSRGGAESAVYIRLLGFDNVTTAVTGNATLYSLIGTGLTSENRISNIFYNPGNDDEGYTRTAPSYNINSTYLEFTLTQPITATRFRIRNGGGNVITYNLYAYDSTGTMYTLITNGTVSGNGTSDTIKNFESNLPATVIVPGNSPSIPTTQITTPYIWNRKGVVLYDASANQATQLITRSSPYLFTNPLASRFNARVYTSSIDDLSGFVDVVATTNAVTDSTYFKPGIYLEVGDVTGANTTSSRTNSFNVQKIEEFLIKDSRVSNYKAYENTTNYDGLARAALNDLPAGTQVDLSGTTWTKDASGALMSSNATTYKHYRGSANPTLIRSAFPTTVMDISNALYKISTIANSTLSAYNWSAAYDLNESQFAYKLAGIVTPIPDVSGSGTKIDDDLIFGPAGIASFSSSNIYPAATVNNNVYANAPTNFNISSLTKSNVPGTALDVNTKLLQITMQASLADTSGGVPLENTVVNSLDYMFDSLNDISNIMVTPTADMTGAEYRLVQTTVRDTGINDPNLPDILYNQITNPLYADVFPNYKVIYRALTSRAYITISGSADLMSQSVGSATALYPTNVPSGILGITDPAVKKSINIFMYGDENKTYGWKYTMDVYVVDAA